MTTIRELCGYIRNLPKQLIEYFNENRGRVPLCCFSVKKSGSQLLITCEWLKEWMTFEDFKAKCLECQREITHRIKEVKKKYTYA